MVAQIQERTYFEKSVLRRKILAKMDEVRGEWRKLHNGELRDLNSSQNKIRMIE
jgi:hypothetical protein